MTQDQMARLIAATEQRLTTAARAAGVLVSGDGRIRESAAAGLLGVHPDTLADWRQKGEAPDFYTLGGRITYRVADLARWIEMGRTTAAAGGRG